MPTRRLVEFMHLYPRQCFVTGYPNSEANGPVLDTGRDVDHYGRIYVTESGAKIIGEHFGLAPAAALEAKIAELEAENAELRARLSRLPDTIERFLDDLQHDTADLVRELLALAPADDGSVAVVDAAGADPGEGGAADDAAGLPDGDRDDAGVPAAVA